MIANGERGKWGTYPEVALRGSERAGRRVSVPGSSQHLLPRGTDVLHVTRPALARPDRAERLRTAAAKLRVAAQSLEDAAKDPDFPLYITTAVFLATRGAADAAVELLP